MNPEKEKRERLKTKGESKREGEKRQKFLHIISLHLLSIA
jgi:hypothetical protein